MRIKIVKTKRKDSLEDLEARYDRNLYRKGASMTQLRKTRDAIIKRRWDMGL